MIVQECPHCGGPLTGRSKRFNVWLTFNKARIVDLLHAAGSDGIEVELLAEALDVQRACLKSHVWQINELLADVGVRIVSHGRPHRTYVLHKEPVDTQPDCC